jgi:hypothetical protein
MAGWYLPENQLLVAAIRGAGKKAQVTDSGIVKRTGAYHDAIVKNEFRTAIKVGQRRGGTCCAGRRKSGRTEGEAKPELPVRLRKNAGASIRKHRHCIYWRLLKKLPKISLALSLTVSAASITFEVIFSMGSFDAANFDL